MSNPPSLPSSMTEVHIVAPGGPQVLQARQVDLPRARAGELLVRVHAAGINRPDVLQRRGLYPMPEGVNPTPGLEIAGEVVAIGERVQGWQLGERVCALTEGGGYAQYCVVPAGQVLRLPEQLDWVRAAAIPETYFTVWANVFQMGAARPGERLLVHGGSSGIGSAALLIAKEMGLIAASTDSSEQKASLARELGAQLSVPSQAPDLVAQVRAWSQGRGVDVVLDIMGASHLQRNLEVLAADGRLLMVGFMGGSVAHELNMLDIALRRLRIMGSTLRARDASQKAAIAQELQRHLAGAWAAGRCLPHVSARFALQDAAQAHACMEARQHLGKLVLEVAHPC